MAQYTLAEPRYVVRDLITGKFITGIYHQANLKPELRYLRRQGRRFYVVDRKEVV